MNLLNLRQIIILLLLFFIGVAAVGSNQELLAKGRSKYKNKRKGATHTIPDNITEPKPNITIDQNKNGFNTSTILSKFGTSKLVAKFDLLTTNDINNQPNQSIGQQINQQINYNSNNQSSDQLTKITNNSHDLNNHTNQPKQIHYRQYEGTEEISVTLPIKAELEPYSGRFSQDMIQKIDTISSYYHLDPRLIKEIVHQESSFNPRARSGKSAMGLMQMIPSTATRFGVRDPYNADESLHGGCRYLVWLLRRFGGRLDLTLAGYNAGEGAVKKYSNRVPPYKETQDYVRVITNRYLTRLQVKQAHLSNQLVKYQTSYPSSYHKRTRGKSRSFDQNNNQYNNGGSSNKGFSPKATKEKLDVLDSYFKKKQ